MKLKAKHNSKASPGNAMPKPVIKTGKNLRRIQKLANTNRPSGWYKSSTDK